MEKNSANPVYRVDKFIVPVAAREEFLEKVRATHLVLAQQPGFVRDLLLEQTAGPGEFNIVTLAEWESQEVIEGARLAVQALHRQMGFDPQALIQRLGIRADMAGYQSIAR